MNLKLYKLFGFLFNSLLLLTLLSTFTILADEKYKIFFWIFAIAALICKLLKIVFLKVLIKQYGDGIKYLDYKNLVAYLNSEKELEYVINKCLPVKGFKEDLELYDRRAYLVGGLETTLKKHKLYDDFSKICSYEELYFGYNKYHKVIFFLIILCVIGFGLSILSVNYSVLFLILLVLLVQIKVVEFNYSKRIARNPEAFKSNKQKFIDKVNKNLEKDQKVAEKIINSNKEHKGHK